MCSNVDFSVFSFGRGKFCLCMFCLYGLIFAPIPVLEQSVFAQPGRGNAQRGNPVQGNVVIQGSVTPGNVAPGSTPPPWAERGQPNTRMQVTGGQPSIQGNQRPPQGGQQPQTRPPQQNRQPQQAQSGGGSNQVVPNQVTQMMGRLRGMDANGNGVLEASEIPANQRDRVNNMITQLGGNPNANQFNLANLERRATGNNQQNNQQRQDGQQGNQQRQTVEPLVRPFGESRVAEQSVLRFGQRATTQQSSPQTGRGQQNTRQQRDSVQANQQAIQAARSANTLTLSTHYDRIPAVVRNNAKFAWFFDYDADNDAQLTMLEYVSGRGGTWTMPIADEFTSLDRNGDGLVTADEALETIKEWEELRAEEERSRTANQTQGRPASGSSTPNRDMNRVRAPGNTQQRGTFEQDGRAGAEGAGNNANPRRRGRN